MNAEKAVRMKDVPATPTHCQGRGCGALLEPMRRYAGLCKACVAKRAKRRKPPVLMRVLRSFVRHGERFVEVQCACGNRRIMRLWSFNDQRPTRCKRCRLRAAADLRAAGRKEKA